MNMKTFSWLVAVGLVLGSLAPGLSMAAKASTTSMDNSSMTIGSTSAASAQANTAMVNLNTADVTTLETVKGLGATKAQAIISYRQQHGNFSKVADVTSVPGIGPKLLAKIQAQLTV